VIIRIKSEIGIYFPISTLKLLQNQSLRYGFQITIAVLGPSSTP
jgi:hypothetical protein